MANAQLIPATVRVRPVRDEAGKVCFRIWLAIGCQSFELAGEPEDWNAVRWHAQMIRTALNNCGANVADGIQFIDGLDDPLTSVERVAFGLEPLQEPDPETLRPIL